MISSGRHVLISHRRDGNSLEPSGGCWTDCLPTFEPCQQVAFSVYSPGRLPVRFQSAVPFIGAFESTYMPAHDVDILETCGHVDRWRDDLELLRAHGVARLRYPIRWHRIERQPGEYDWSHTDDVMAYMRSEGFDPIVDLVHHTSYPRWLTGSFADRRFPSAYEAFCEAFARRYSWIREFTLFNKPFATLFLSGHEAVWPPYEHGMDGFVRLLRNVLPAIARTSRRFEELLPGARHVWVDSCEGHTALDSAGEEFAHLANDRRFFALDDLLGRATDRARPFIHRRSRRRRWRGPARDRTRAYRRLGARLLRPPRMGLLRAHHRSATSRRAPSAASAGPGDPHRDDVEGRTPSPAAQGLARLARQYLDHADLPMILGETNMAGSPFDRATWLKHTLEQCERARADGVPIDGYCWFGSLDSLDWISLLSEHEGSIDPVGVIWLDEQLRRNESSMSRSYAAAAGGVGAADLPAYRLTDDMRAWVGGLLPLMSHFDWLQPPQDELNIYASGRFTAGDTTTEVAA